MKHQIIVAIALLAAPLLVTAVSAQSSTPMTKAQIDRARLADDKTRAAARERAETPSAADARAEQKQLATDKAKAMSHHHPSRAAQLADDKARAAARERAETPNAADMQAERDRLATDKARAMTRHPS